MKAKKELGQNFLLDLDAINVMVDSLNIVDGDVVVEIGPGLGAVTKKIASSMNNTNNLYAIEFDPRCIPELENNFKQENIKIIHENILDWLNSENIARILQNNRTLKIIGSLPYYITSPIIHKILQLEPLPETVSILIQKEVGDKVSEGAPNASYMSTIVQTFYDVENVYVVDKNFFDPTPSVDGMILKLSKKFSKITPPELKKYEGFLHKGFSNPRKMMNKVFTDEELKSFNLDPKLRPQNVEVDKWIEMFKIDQQSS